MILPGRVTIASPMGKVLGLLSLAALVGFVAACWALVTREGRWRTAMASSSMVSLAVVAARWRSSAGTTSLNATLGDIGLLVFALLPAADEVIGAA